MDKFNFDIQKEQYDCIIKIINTVSQYHRLLYDFNNTTKFKYFRPKLKLSSVFNNKKEDGNKDKINVDKHQVFIEWWKYAKNMILWQKRYIKNYTQNDMPQRRKL